VRGCYRYSTPADCAAAGAQAVGLDELLTRSDVVTLHVPLTSRTRHMIGARELALMKANAVLVNTARGPVVDQLALAEALESHTIEGAACDVFEREPVPV